MSGGLTVTVSFQLWLHNKKGSQIDIVVLDLSKSFDTVPHDGLLSKHKHYVIDDKIWLWIYNVAPIFKKGSELLSYISDMYYMQAI